MPQFPHLPTDFILGTSTAAYQIEGAVDADGRGTSIWDVFCAEPGRIKTGEDGRVACDHYHRHAEDVALMGELGLDAYRFSIAWPRIQPDGTGPVNAAGLDFYDRLVDELLAVGVAPAPTLFHWDLPQALQEQGGWLSRSTAEHFAEYARIVGERLADRVPMWMTLNEPVVVTTLGHAIGVHAPGMTLGFDALPVAHHLLLGHGLAVEALRSAGARSVGIASNHAPTWAASDAPEDVAAAEQWDNIVNWTFADPMLAGHYPEGFAEAMPGPVDDDLRTISAPLDFYGINYYQPTLVGAPSDEGAESQVLDGAMLPPGLGFEPRRLDGYPTTDFGWAIVPDALREILVTFQERYTDRMPPIHVTESGCSFHDTVGPDGAVHDQARIEYHHEHLQAVRAAIDEGVDVRGYFAWSLLDNFEWAEGYTERFGLVHVDFDTQVRTPKDSFRWYQELSASRRRHLR